jgi:hypothetical protein
MMVDATDRFGKKRRDRDDLRTIQLFLRRKRNGIGDD